MIGFAIGIALIQTAQLTIPGYRVALGYFSYPVALEYARWEENCGATKTPIINPIDYQAWRDAPGLAPNGSPWDELREGKYYCIDSTHNATPTDPPFPLNQNYTIRGRVSLTPSQ